MSAIPHTKFSTCLSGSEREAERQTPLSQQPR